MNHWAGLESALWTAFRALDERAALFRRLAERAHGRHADISAEHFRAEAEAVNRQADALRAVLLSRPGGDDERESESADR